MDPFLEENFRALEAVNPTLVERLCLPVDSDRVHLDSRETATYRWRQAFHPLAFSPAALTGSLDHLSGLQSAFLFGIGLGEQLDELLRAHPTLTLTVWDRDPYLIRLALNRRSYVDAIASDRLH